MASAPQSDQAGRGLPLKMVSVEECAAPSTHMHDSRLAALSVRELEADDRPRWDAFVSRCPEATFFHQTGWQRVIEETLGHQTHFLYAEDGTGTIVGVLPLV